MEAFTVQNLSFAYSEQQNDYVMIFLAVLF